MGGTIPSTLEPRRLLITWLTKKRREERKKQRKKRREEQTTTPLLFLVLFSHKRRELLREDLKRREEKKEKTRRRPILRTARPGRARRAGAAEDPGECEDGRADRPGRAGTAGSWPICAAATAGPSAARLPASRPGDHPRGTTTPARTRRPGSSSPFVRPWPNCYPTLSIVKHRRGSTLAPRSVRRS